VRHGHVELQLKIPVLLLRLMHVAMITCRYHAEQHTKTDLSFCAMGFLIWVLTFFRIPATAEWHNRALVAAAVVK
jgi:hypothetical protein